MSIRKWSIAFETAPLVVMIVALKYLAHMTGWEILEINPLVSAIVSANIFLLGFLLAGVLTDYKESERLPGELACSLESLVDEAAIVCQTKGTGAAYACLSQVGELGRTLVTWLKDGSDARGVLSAIASLNAQFIAIEPLLAPPFLARMKQEQNVLRRLVTRVDTIRTTSFVGSGYAIAEIATVLLSGGLILLRSAQFHESLFIIVAITFVMIYILLLIRDLDDPFDYASKGSSEDVSLKPLDQALARIDSELARFDGIQGGTNA